MSVKNQISRVTRTGTFAQTTGRQPLSLDVGAPLMRLDLRLRYTITNGASVPTGVQYGTLFQALQLLQRLEVVVNGQDTVWNVQPWLYAQRLITERSGTLPRGMENPLLATSNGVTNVDITLPLHFDLLRGRKINDCGLDLRGIRLVQLYATFGSVANLWAVPNAAVVSNIILDVEANYIDNVPAVCLSGPSKGTPIVFAVRQLDEINFQLVGANSQTTLDIDQRTGVNLTSLMQSFITLAGGVYAGDDTGLINGNTFTGDFKLKSAGEFFKITQAPFLKARTRDDFRLINAGQPATNIINPEFAGAYMMDIRYDGKLSTGIPTGALDANLQMLLNHNYASGNTTWYVQRESVRPLAVTAV